jgi:hypothetical protein
LRHPEVVPGQPRQRTLLTHGGFQSQARPFEPLAVEGDRFQGAQPVLQILDQPLDLIEIGA